MKGIRFFICVLFLSVIHMGFTTGELPEMPRKQISKAIGKIWKTGDFEIIPHSGVACNNNGCWYKVVSQKQELGLVYSGRVNSCRSGGCAIEPADEAMSFEYFDYLLFTNIKGEVLWVKIYNYQATQGHEVMSRGWLNQFKGTVPGAILKFGYDVETISGATVSARAITTDIQQVLACAF